ncbi:MAG: hypothetical protein JKY08_06045 [Flavobacteriaceae bacterium]|nr:hypothetical protein [Flavobacteriaceae bacterium]
MITSKKVILAKKLAAGKKYSAKMYDKVRKYREDNGLMTYDRVQKDEELLNHIIELRTDGRIYAEISEETTVKKSTI